MSDSEGWRNFGDLLRHSETLDPDDIPLGELPTDSPIRQAAQRAANALLDQSFFDDDTSEDYVPSTPGAIASTNDAVELNDMATAPLLPTDDLDDSKLSQVRIDPNPLGTEMSPGTISLDTPPIATSIDPASEYVNLPVPTSPTQPVTPFVNPYDDSVAANPLADPTAVQMTPPPNDLASFDDAYPSVGEMYQTPPTQLIRRTGANVERGPTPETPNSSAKLFPETESPIASSSNAVTAETEAESSASVAAKTTASELAEDAATTAESSWLDDLTMPEAAPLLMGTQIGVTIYLHYHPPRLTDETTQRVRQTHMPGSSGVWRPNPILRCRWPLEPIPFYVGLVPRNPFCSKVEMVSQTGYVVLQDDFRNLAFISGLDSTRVPGSVGFIYGLDISYHISCEPMTTTPQVGASARICVALDQFPWRAAFDPDLYWNDSTTDWYNAQLRDCYRRRFTVYADHSTEIVPGYETGAYNGITITPKNSFTLNFRRPIPFFREGTSGSISSFLRNCIFLIGGSI